MSYPCRRSAIQSPVAKGVWRRIVHLQCVGWPIVVVPLYTADPYHQRLQRHHKTFILLFVVCSEYYCSITNDIHIWIHHKMRELPPLSSTLRYYNMVTLRQEIHPLEGAVLRPHHPTHPSAGAPPLLLHHTTPSQNIMNATKDNRLQDSRDNSNKTARCLLTKVGDDTLSVWPANDLCCNEPI